MDTESKSACRVANRPRLQEEGGGRYGIFQQQHQCTADSGCGDWGRPGSLGCRKSDGGIWSGQPSGQCSCTVKKQATENKR